MTTRKVTFSIAALSAATLLLESMLTRLLAVAQFYHFSFLVVSLALLGFGISGTLLSVVPGFREIPITRLLAILGLGFVISALFAFAAINFLPFDSYSIAWDRRQILLFVFYYLVLTIPFVLSGLGIGAALSSREGNNHLIYAANLIGSGVGALVAPGVLWLAGVPGAVSVGCVFGGITTFIILPKGRLRQLVAGFITVGLFILTGLTMLNFQSRLPLGLTISPYKGMAQAQRIPDSKVVFSRWNAISYLAVISSAGIHQLPGLSYLYPDLPPHQDGISLDGDALQAITLSAPQDFTAATYLPESVAFEMIPNSDILVLEPGGGLGVLQALAGGANRVTAVVDNALVPQGVAHSNPAFDVYRNSQVNLVHEPARSYLQRSNITYDLIYLPLTDAYRPVASGAYSLSEEYELTVEAFAAIVKCLNPEGIFIFTRWIQSPPSESLRAVGTLVEALERNSDRSAAETLIIYRGIQTMTVLARPSGWTPEMLSAIRKFAEERKYDLVWVPDIRMEEVNRFNRMMEPDYYLAIRELLNSTGRSGFLTDYPYNIIPPTDDQPFFYHFFKWGQVPEVLAAMGHTWQPFGGSGYLVLLALLILTILLSGILIILPLKSLQEKQRRYSGQWSVFVYFGLIGVAFLFVEIPLIQKWILFLGHPIYAFTAVVATLLIFSGIGSAISRASWLPHRSALITLPLLAMITFLGLTQYSDLVLGWPMWARIGITIICLAPLGLWMGFPFPIGLVWLQQKVPGWEPWAWAVNGCASVIASVLAAILSLSAGFSFVLILGAGAYAGAAGLYLWMLRNQ